MMTDNTTPMLRRRPARKFAMISTYPPTACGIATFAAALGGGLEERGAEVGIVRVGGPREDSNDRVIAQFSDVDGMLSGEALARLHEADVVVVQHEYGIYPGRDGESIVAALAAIERPTIVVAHTILEHPTSHQRSVLEDVVRFCDALVVMTEAGRTRLCSGFDVDPSKISVIPHGAAVVAVSEPRPHRLHPLLLTWGLLGPGKGIEWAIDALALLKNLNPHAVYRIAGDTHPKVAALEGESYREMLARRALGRGVSDNVQFDAGYRDLPALAELISEASIVVLPYDSPDQVTSGVLVDAIAAGRPVVATAFPHAIELLSSGAGIVVPRRDPVALANALRTILSNPRLAESMAAEARRLAPSLAWSSVAARYATLGEKLIGRGARVSA
jgi:glycosyltransferase involved in cell wall biosynthesis